VAMGSADESIPFSDCPGDGNQGQNEAVTLSESNPADRMPFSKRPVRNRHRPESSILSECKVINL
jgi:hypothetical protein